LSHTVYLEFGLESHALVILFGAMQVYVPLPKAEGPAIIGYLDPITGKESFTEIERLNMAPVPQSLTEAEIQIHLSYIMRMLSLEAIERGAKRAPDLSLLSV